MHILKIAFVISQHSLIRYCGAKQRTMVGFSPVEKENAKRPQRLDGFYLEFV